MMEYFDDVTTRVANGQSASQIVTELNIKRNTAVKLCQLARIRLGMVALPFEIDELRDMYEAWSLPVEAIADAYDVSVSSIKDIVRAHRLSRDAGATIRAGHATAWNAGKTKESDERIAALSIKMQGSGNHRYGEKPWNAGLTAQDDIRVAAVAVSITGLSPSKETRGKMAAAKRGKTGPAANRWSGGHTIGGYATGAGKSYEHRRVAEEILNRKLLTEEHVHHVDRDRQNNDPSNLLVIGARGHARLHGAIYREPNIDQRKWLNDNGIAFEELKVA